MLKQRPGLALYMASDVVEHLGESQTQVQDFTDGNTMVYLIWVNYNDLTATSLESWLVRGIIPKWPYFRLVKYYNLPRFDQFWSYLIIVFRSPCSPLILSCAKHVLHVWPWLTMTDHNWPIRLSDILSHCTDEVERAILELLHGDCLPPSWRSVESASSGVIKNGWLGNPWTKWRF